QNVKTSADWQEKVAADFATERGLHLEMDDRLRRELLQQLYGHGVVDRHRLGEQFGIDFDEYFAAEQARLHELVAEGLVVLDGEQIRLTAPPGRLLVRVVAAVFARYLPADAFRVGLPAQQSSRVG